MFLSQELVRWAVRRLHTDCHPFVGITFLAAKRSGMPVGHAREMSLDRVTREHLDTYHRLDPQSEFYFQPFKSSRYWVTASYPSSGLQAINTQTFQDVFRHRRQSRSWAFVDHYVETIQSKIHELPGVRPPPLVALAIWIGKDESWQAGADLADIVDRFVDAFALTRAECDHLFDTSLAPLSVLPVTSEERTDLKEVAHSFAAPPDAPGQTEATLTSIHLVSVGPARELRLNFGQRLTLIAGDNGLGKSFLLDVAWWAITGTWAALPAYPLSARSAPRPRIEYTITNALGKELNGGADFAWRTYSWQRRAPGPVAAVNIYARADGSFAIGDETRARLEPDRKPGVWRFTNEEVWYGKEREIEGLLRDWVHWQLSSESESFVMLRRVLQHLSPDERQRLEPGDPVRLPGDARHIPTIRQIYDTVPIVLASAGVQRVLTLAYLMIWTWREHELAAEQANVPVQRKMVILVDELEAHLHPKWQRVVLPALMSVGKLLSTELEVQVIAATHSPLVLASIEDDFSPASDVLTHLSTLDDAVTLEEIEFYKYGDMSSWLVSPVFGLTHARSRSAEQAIEAAKRVQLSDSPTPDEVTRLDARLKEVLSPDDPFWSRWVFFAQQIVERG